MTTKQENLLPIGSPVWLKLGETTVLGVIDGHSVNQYYPYRVAYHDQEGQSTSMLCSAENFTVAGKYNYGDVVKIVPSNTLCVVADFAQAESGSYDYHVRASGLDTWVNESELVEAAPEFMSISQAIKVVQAGYAELARIQGNLAEEQKKIDQMTTDATAMQEFVATNERNLLTLLREES